VTEDRTPIEQAVDLAVFAPIGFALEARRLLPSFVERGRQQVTMAKMVGQFAVSHGQTTAAKRLTKVQEQAEQLLGELGLAPLAATTAPAAPAQPTPDGEPAAAAAAPVRSGAGADELAIAGYDTLAASQVIPRLAGLSPSELAAVEAYELAHRGRKTILGKVAQLRAE
jgi:hypothetical protein